MADQIHLRHRREDQTLTFRRQSPRGPGAGELSISMTPDDPRDYDYEGAVARVSELDEARLRWWLATGEALPINVEIPDPSESVIDVAHLQRQIEWSRTTFGPGARTQGLIDHITKELGEIAADPSDLKEWIDIIILGIDGAWRSGHSAAEIVAALKAKQAVNEARTWPDWRTADPERAIEHVREEQA